MNGDIPPYIPGYAASNGLDVAQGAGQGGVQGGYASTSLDLNAAGEGAGAVSFRLIAFAASNCFEVSGGTSRVALPER
jgi:hypothetical protein